MTKNEAIKQIESLLTGDGWNNETREALNLALEAMERNNNGAQHTRTKRQAPVPPPMRLVREEGFFKRFLKRLLP